jgi:hypothetical protein
MAFDWQIITSLLFYLCIDLRFLSEIAGTSKAEVEN